MISSNFIINTKTKKNLQLSNRRQHEQILKLMLRINFHFQKEERFISMANKKLPSQESAWCDNECLHSSQCTTFNLSILDTNQVGQNYQQIPCCGLRCNNPKDQINTVHILYLELCRQYLNKYAIIWVTSLATLHGNSL